jgi:hypothetical protein
MVTTDRQVHKETPLFSRCKKFQVVLAHHPKHLKHSEIALALTMHRNLGLRNIAMQQNASDLRGFTPNSLIYMQLKN